VLRGRYQEGKCMYCFGATNVKSTLTPAGISPRLTCLATTPYVLNMAAYLKRLASDIASTIPIGTIAGLVWFASDNIDTANVVWVTDRVGRSYIQNTGGHDVRINTVSFPDALQPPLYVAGTILCPLASVRVSDMPESPRDYLDSVCVQYQCMSTLGRSLVKEKTLTLTESTLPLPFV
jgi:hypothetical protein